MKSVPAVIFDMDGTLIDPFVGISNAYRHLCATLGYEELTDDQVRRLIGPPVQEAITSQFHLEHQRRDEAVAIYREYYGTQGVREYTPYLGIDAVLSSLDKDGFHLYVATSKPKVFADEIVEDAGWTALFHGVGGATMDGSLRHKDQVIAWVLDRFGSGERALALVGDRPEDVASARIHDLACVGVSWGFSSPETLVGAGAHQVVHTSEELFAVLSALAQEMS